ncbi:MAG: lipoate--protein ligase [Oscillospiraceae bacterium]|nr:lipoate--protein ligase [Oscillospiraceae bacterium]
MKLSYLNLATTDPAWNLAAEQYVFDCLPRDRMYVMLWQNDNAIIVGKYQNTLAEINRAFVEEHGIRVVRRLSGGGAVYHDLGNLNYTFISDAGNEPTVNFRVFCEPVVQALARLGVTAEINGRNDITIDERKFSGNAQYLREGRVMHHGTILFDAKLDTVQQALQVDPAKIASKGRKSVRSRVTNVCEHLPKPYTMDEFRAVLLDEIASQGEEYVFTPEDIAAIDQIRAERYATWEWNYGSSPKCTLLRRARIEGCGLVEAYINVENGLVSGVEFRGDFFSQEEPQNLEKYLVGLRPERSAFAEALADVDVARYFAALTTEQLVDILSE